jgi:lipopolysaccharide assembly protein B
MDLSSWLWIILFITFSLGWFLARYDIKTINNKKQELPLEYFHGLQHLLNEKPDLAIDSFLKIAKTDPETLELQFALGQMFRKKGEFNRSIRIHESIYNREKNLDYRDQAHVSLGEDYYKAGMFDKSKRIFNQFIKHKKYQILAIKHLLIIAKLEQNWQEAIYIAHNLQQENEEQKKLKQLQIFHLNMQHIDELINNKQYSIAQQKIELMPEKINDISHPRYILADIRLKAHIINKTIINDNDNDNNEINNIILALINILDKYSYTQRFIMQLIEQYDKCKPELNFSIHFMSKLQLIGKSNSNMLSIYHQINHKNILESILNKNNNSINISNSSSDKQSLQFIKKDIEQEMNSNTANTMSLQRYTDLLSNINDAQTYNPIYLNQISKILHKHAQHNYICKECGFRSAYFSWSCHSCGEWESLDNMLK